MSEDEEIDDFFKILRDMMRGGFPFRPGLHVFRLDQGQFKPIEKAQPKDAETPYTEIAKIDNRYEIILEMPGVELDHLKWSVFEGKLIITGEGVFKRYIQRININQFGTIDWENVKTTINNGIAIITLKKL